MRYLKWLLVALCVTSLGLSGCADDTGSADGAVANNGGGSNNGGANNGGSNNGGANNGGSNNGGANNGGANNGTCTPAVIFEEVYQPNVYMALDRSQSMDGEPMTQAKAGLDVVADELAGRIRLGVGAYPFPSAGCGLNDMVAVGANSADDLKQAWQDLTAAGGTPTGTAIYQVRDRQLLSEEVDQYDAKRDKALVMITDGDPTVCEDEHPFLDEARTLAGQGVPIFVVGFRSLANPDNLNDLAEAGGTDAPGADRFYTANSTSELAEAIRDISTSVIGCTHPLDPAPQSADLLSVEIDGDAVPQSTDDGFSYEAGAGELTIHGSWCERLQDAARDGTVLEITVNCPGCTAAGQSCTDGAECCSGSCDDGVCTRPCQTAGQTCQSSDDCCNGACVKESELTGTCVDG